MYRYTFNWNNSSKHQDNIYPEEWDTIQVDAEDAWEARKKCEEILDKANEKWVNLIYQTHSEIVKVELKFVVYIQIFSGRCEAVTVFTDCTSSAYNMILDAHDQAFPNDPIVKMEWVNR